MARPQVRSLAKPLWHTAQVALDKLILVSRHLNTTYVLLLSAAITTEYFKSLFSQYIGASLITTMTQKKILFEDNLTIAPINP